MITIINYNVGNLVSIQNMLKKIGLDSKITNDKDDINNATHILLPGVGHFANCMTEFNNSGLRGTIEKNVLQNKKPLLGICVGHQMLFQKSEEGGCNGLGWIDGEVVFFEKSKMNTDLKIPNMGWCDLTLKNQCSLFTHIENPRYYMVHSYHAICNEESITSTANHGYEFVASVQQNNIYGTQFHPEKSHKFGMQLLKNFSLL